MPGPSPLNNRLKLLDQLERGLTLPAACHVVGLDRRSVYRRHADHLPKDRKGRHRFVLPLHLAGHSTIEISRLLRLPHSRVIAILYPHAMKLPPHPPRGKFGSWFRK